MSKVVHRPGNLQNMAYAKGGPRFLIAHKLKFREQGPQQGPQKFVFQIFLTPHPKIVNLLKFVYQHF